METKKLKIKLHVREFGRRYTYHDVTVAELVILTRKIQRENPYAKWMYELTEV